MIEESVFEDTSDFHIPTTVLCLKKSTGTVEI